METDLFFGTEADDSVFDAATQLAAAPATKPSPEDALPTPLDAARVVIPEGEHVVRVTVTPGEVVELPFGPDAHFEAKEANGNLAIRVGDVVVILEGYAAGGTPPVIETADGHPLDIASILAATDPNIDIQTAAGPNGQGGQGADNTGAIFQQLGGEAGLGGLQGVGGQGDSNGPNGGPGVEQTGNTSHDTTTITNTAPVAEDLTVATDEDHVFSGTLPASDADGDPLTYELVGALPKDVTFNKDGTWSFDPTVDYNKLDTGDVETVTFQYKANDGQADSNTATVTIHIAGVNDAPEWVAGTLTIGFEEDAVGAQRQLIFGINDPDDTAFTITLQTPLPAGFTYDPTTFTVTGTPAGLYDDIGAFGEKDITLTFDISDGEASTTHDITLQIFGTNDAPVIGGTGTALNYTENDPATAIAGAATIKDVDSGNFNGGSLRVSLGATGKAEDALSILNQGTGAGEIGISGSDVTYGGTKIGTWSGGASGTDLAITFTSDDATVAAAQALLQHIAYADSSNNPSGADRTASFTLVDGDGKDFGGTDTGTASATIHVTPVNDPPEIVAGLTFFSISEDTTGNTQALGLFVQDPDDSVFTISAVGALPTGITYDAAADQFKLDVAGHYDYLKAGESESFIINFQASDGQASSNKWSVTAEILGENDTAKITGDTTGAVTEDSGIAANGKITVTDLDHDEALLQTSGTFLLNYGTLELNADGTWKYTLDDTKDAVNQLGPKDTLTDTLTVKSLDGTASQDLVITIHGHNDAPVLSSLLLSDSVGEDAKGIVLPLNNAATITDPDSTSFTYSLVGTVPDGLTLDADGTLHIDPAGHYDYLAAGQSASFVVSYKVTDDGGADSNILTFKFGFNGVNDAPVPSPDTILTNAGSSLFFVPEWAILANDKDPDSPSLSIASLMWESPDLFLDHGGGQFTLADMGPLGATFQYGSSDKLTQVFTTVSIFNQAGGDLHGTSNYEILVGSGVGDRIDGGGGKDLIFGGDGDDTLIFHDGDTVQGGGDSIPQKITNLDPHGDVLAVDHDVDFTKLDLTHFGGIETISLSEAGAGAGTAQSITIDASDVTTLSDHVLKLLDVIYTEHSAIRIDLEAVDQLYLQSSKSGDSWIEYTSSADYALFAHQTTAGDGSTTDAYVIVHTPIADPSVPVPNVHLNT